MLIRIIFDIIKEKIGMFIILNKLSYCWNCELYLETNVFNLLIKILNKFEINMTNIKLLSTF
jgi:hypothetical protein